MLIFKKNKIKLSLIEDYISILFIKNFFENDFSSIPLSDQDKDIFLETKKQTNSLFIIYESVFKRIKMYDLSLLILKKELKDNNILYAQTQNKNFHNISQTINQFKQKLIQITNSLIGKQKLLKLK